MVSFRSIGLTIGIFGGELPGLSLNVSDEKWSVLIAKAVVAAMVMMISADAVCYRFRPLQMERRRWHCLQWAKTKTKFIIKKK